MSDDDIEGEISDEEDVIVLGGENMTPNEIA